jgi:hypothetical protein
VSEEQKLEDEQIKEQVTAKELINEASSKLSAAIQSSNMQSAKVAQLMLTTGNQKLQESSKKFGDIRLKIGSLRKRLATCENKERITEEPITTKKK